MNFSAWLRWTEKSLEDELALSTLMVCLRVDRSNAELLAVAADIGKRFGSHIIGVAARQVSAPGYIRGAGPSGAADHDMRRFTDQAAAAEREFRTELSGFGPLDWRMQMTLGPACEYIADEARCADLVIASVGPHALFASGHAEVGDLLMRLGRPIMTAPAGASFAFCQALACFKEVREARRVLADALPVLQAMKRVMVLEIVESGSIEASKRRLDDVTTWLARHGVVAASDAVPAQGAVAQQLAALARDLGADLIVAGAFGHSRLREWAFGGVTRDLLLRSDRCVLSSH
jgi:nucleotide-binding universal stress UspA family protein